MLHQKWNLMENVRGSIKLFITDNVSGYIENFLIFIQLLITAKWKSQNAPLCIEQNK